MGYGPISSTEDVMNLKENEYCLDSPVQTAPLTSCYVVVAPVRYEEKLLAISIGFTGSGGDFFDDAAADEVVKILKDNRAEVDQAWIVGQTDFWSSDSPPGYDRLMDNLEIRDREEERQVKTPQDKAIKLTADDAREGGFKVDIID